MVELHVVAVATQVRFLGGAPFYMTRVVSSVVRIPAFQAGGPGSIPGRRTIFALGLRAPPQTPCGAASQNSSAWGISSIGRVRALQARGTGIETRILHLLYLQLSAALAQLGERQTEDLKVPGSIPGGGIFSREHIN